jgi:paired amphipathic helix protein Sin3a
VVSSITSQTVELRIAIDVQILYSHLHLFKNIAMERANDLAFNTTSNTTTADLKLMQALSDPQEGQTQITAFQYYELMLETCEWLFNNQMEQLIFKDQMREMFGLHASFPAHSPWLSSDTSSGCVQNIHNR